ncbi:TPA: TIGR03749 family integrating conjugative element protein [Proteus mirabilis]
MSKFRHALQNRDQHILTLRMICGVLVLCLFVAFAGWMRAPAKLTIHNPPDLRSGSTRAWWEVPLPTVYAFSFYIFQQLNAWPKDGEVDYPRKIAQLSAYLTPSCRAYFEKEAAYRTTLGELKGRSRVVYSGEVSTQRDSQSVRRSGQAAGAAADAVPESVDRKAKTRYPAPLPVLLTRYAAQSLYAPLRTVEPVSGVQPLPLTLPKTLTALYPSEPLIARPLAGWQAAEYRVVAVKLTNQSAQKVVLDPRQLQGQFVSATFQHQWLDAKGTPEDTTTVYLVMKGKPDKAFPAEPPARRTGGKAR